MYSVFPEERAFSLSALNLIEVASQIRVATNRLEATVAASWLEFAFFHTCLVGLGSVDLIRQYSEPTVIEDPAENCSFILPDGGIVFG